MRERITLLYLLLMFEWVGMIVMPLVPRNDLYYVAGNLFCVGMMKAIEPGCLSQLWFDIYRLVFVQFLLQALGWLMYRCHVPASDFYNPSIIIIEVVTFTWLFIGRIDDKSLARPSGFWLFLGDFGMGDKQTARHLS